MINFSKIFDHPIYEVGGCVRDSLLKLPIKDVDLASSLTPQEFKNLCRERRLKTFDTGIEHGTITVMIDKIPYEHTTFRKDVSCDGRNATVTFSKTIEEDLSRRDFTINAIARLDDVMIDPFDGRHDLTKRLLRTVGNAEERFSEDYLRIIRAARFKSRLKLTATDELLSAAQKLSPQILPHVSIERISDEFRKAQKHGAAFLEDAELLGFLKLILPITSETNKEKWLLEVERSQTLSELHFWAAILIEPFGSKAADKAAEFKLSRHICRGIDLLYIYGVVLEEALSPGALRKLIISTKDYYADLKTYTSSVKNNPEVPLPNLESINKIESLVVASIRQPFIDGSFLKQAGLKPGPHFKLIIDQCGTEQATGADCPAVEKLATKLIQTYLEKDT